MRSVLLTRSRASGASSGDIRVDRYRPTEMVKWHMNHIPYSSSKTEAVNETNKK